MANRQPVVGRLDHYARNKTWIAASWAGDDRSLEPKPYSEEQKKEWTENPEPHWEAWEQGKGFGLLADLPSLVRFSVVLST